MFSVVPAVPFISFFSGLCTVQNVEYAYETLDEHFFTLLLNINLRNIKIRFCIMGCTIVHRDFI